jgi:hypothetical protein
MTDILIENKNMIKDIIEKAKFSTDKYGTVVIFTNGNDWYIPTLIHNLLKSMNIHEPNRKIIVFCSDKEGYDKCKELGFEYFEFVDIPNLMVSDSTSDTSASTTDYTRLSFVKTVIVKFILDLGYTPLYLDPDMAFLRPAIDDLLSYLDTNDFVCAGTQRHLNSNIMLVKPVKFNKMLFTLQKSELDRVLSTHPNNIIYPNTLCKSLYTYSDEDVLRPRLLDQQFTCVDEVKYPDGNHAVMYKKKANIIHSNCVIGLDNKINLMKKCDAWFLDTGLISDEFMVDVKHIFPVFLKGELFETYFNKYIVNNNPKMTRKYINVSWTNLYCSKMFKNIPYDSAKLQKELDSLPPDDKYFTVVQFADGLKHKLPPDTIVYGGSEGDFPMPLTYQNKEFSSLKKKCWDDKNIFCSFLGQHSHTLRKKVYSYVSQFSDYYYTLISDPPCDIELYMKLYIEKCIDSKFCLAPRGYGRSSFRFFEVLQFGSIPVYIWDDKNWSPFQDKIDYSKLCITINISQLDSLDSILRNVSKVQYEEMLNYYNTVKHLFTYDGMCVEISNQFIG